MKIALISLNQFWEDKESNWSSCKKYIESAAARDVELIIFPEMTLTGFSTDVQKMVKIDLPVKLLKNLVKLPIDII